MHDDFRDILTALVRADARFIVVGAHALAAHGVPRVTGDLDVFVDATADNAARVWGALAAFGAPLLGRETFLRNKRASGRRKDLLDIESLGG